MYGTRDTALRPFSSDKPNGEPRQGFASPAYAALDPARRLTEDTGDQGEALLRIAQTRDSLRVCGATFRPANGLGRPLTPDSRITVGTKRVAGQPKGLVRKTVLVKYRNHLALSITRRYHADPHFFPFFHI